MTNTQLYLAVGIPALLALINITVSLVLFTYLGARIESLSQSLSGRIDALTGAVNDLDKRLTRVEVKLGIQP